MAEKTQETKPPRQSVLHSRHGELGAVFSEELFTGEAYRRFLIPEHFGDPDAEHRAVRSAAGMFDLSHTGLLMVVGSGAAGALDRFFTNDVAQLDGPGKCQYTLACDERGGIFADLILYRFTADGFMLTCGSHRWYDLAMAIEDSPPDGVEVRVLNDSHVCFAVEGPEAGAILDELGLPTGHSRLSFEIGSDEWGDPFVNRWGSSGEDGYTLILPNADARRLWDALLDRGVRPCGLRAREQLRIEMGYPSVPADLIGGVTPNQARLGWAVAWGKEAFSGKVALDIEQAAGPSHRLWGLELLGDRVIEPGGPRAGAVYDGGREVGEVTSAGYSPTLDKSIALALIEADLGPGSELELHLEDGSGEDRIRARVVKPPFIPEPRR
ncbi:aminomethyltransferase family protein [Glycomyces buryatensis]|uniref:Aminomethyl transferase family protein n=1 Tax=Glycomyces buryatensis TaxID=2570927 RepID=A0A4S8QSL3_9ACTN|nr:aminomethyltransferase family protein [Glycomyces buryatensis]THV43624.1 aminomethyl transferase family protein [Glycomyces buryatensis]